MEDYNGLTTFAMNSIASWLRVADQGGLEVWASIGQAIRSAMRSTVVFDSSLLSRLPPQFVPTDLFDPATKNAFMNYVVLIGILVAFAGLTLLAFPFIVGCVIARSPKKRAQRGLAAGSKAGASNSPAPPSSRAQLYFGLLFVLQLILAMCLTQGNAFTSRGIAGAFGAINNATSELVTYLDRVQPVLRRVIDEVAASADPIARDLSMRALVNPIASTTDLMPGTDALVNSLSQLSAHMGAFRQDLSAVQTEASTLVNNVTDLRTRLSDVVSATINLNQRVQTNTSEDYMYPTTINGATNVVSIALPALADAVSIAVDGIYIVDALPSISGRITLLRRDSSSADSNVRNLAAAGATPIAQAYTDTAAIAKNTAGQVLTPFLGLTKAIVESVYESVSGMSKTVRNADIGRYFGALAMSALVILSFLISGLGIATTSPKAPRVGSGLVLLLAILLFAMSAVSVILSVLVGDVCPINNSAPSARSFQLISLAARTPVNGNAMARIFETVDYCGVGVAGQPALKANWSLNANVSFALHSAIENNTRPGEAAQVLGFTDLNMLSKLTAAPYVAEMVIQQPFRVGYTQHFATLNPSLLAPTAHELMNDLYAISPGQRIYDSSVWAYFNNLQTSVDTAPLATLRSNLINARDTATTSSFTYYGTYNSTQQQRVLVDFRARVNSVIVAVDAAMSLAANTISTRLPNVKNRGVNASNRASYMEGAMNTVHSGVLRVLSGARSVIDIAQARVLALATDSTLAAYKTQLTSQLNRMLSVQLTCTPAARAIKAIDNSVCTTMLAGLDALWLALAFAGLCCLPACRVFYTLFRSISALREQAMAGTGSGAGSGNRPKAKDAESGSFNAKPGQISTNVGGPVKQSAALAAASPT
ncbi:hypothetical protein BCR44DRAFT_76011 [Catenaria anguillulae PL171]|uniref:Uncharacterized protein n=1 Tax=Catenaria anguillulae PL171 TaxID=765915 RepID=A0A1Y2HQ49_9FUNG|nr:hypothetical protein BCR44DRAFT_76011 [Catenaria anguillulae PL171]